VGRRHHPRLRGGRLYIRLQEEFAYLAVILDAFSRRAIGWAMADHLGASLAVAALAMALAARSPSWGSLVHHSDRGVQYACAEYTHLLEARGIAASMSRVGNPYDNAKVERFIRTLKSEEIDGTLYRDHRDAAGHIGGVHRPGLQPSALALRARLSNARRIRPSTARGPSLPHLSPRWVFKGYGNLR
jgi:putative transposase